MNDSEVIFKPEKKVVSVIICTFNRSQNLESCFQHLLAQEGCEHIDWEIILVDNNSNDATADVMSQIMAGSPIPVCYLFEPQQGLSYARNRGICETRSKYLIFIDDDIHVSKNWLVSIYRTFEEQGCDAVGGRIHLNLDSPLPDWIQPDMYGFLGYRDFGDKSFRMDGYTQFPFGGNMSFRREALLSCGEFDTQMGRVGEGRLRKELFKGEETDIFRRLADMGAKIIYQPDAVVYHNIMPHQLKKSFFRVVHFNAGYQRAFVGELEFSRSIKGVPPYLLLQFLRAVIKYGYQTVSKGPSFAFRQQMNIGYFMGMILGAWRKYSAGQCPK